VEAYAHKIGKEKEIQTRDLLDEESLHVKRERFVNTHLKQHFSIYRRLYDKSRKCRYDPTYYEKLRNLGPYYKRLMKTAEKIKDVLK